MRRLGFVVAALLVGLLPAAPVANGVTPAANGVPPAASGSAPVPTAIAAAPGDSAALPDASTCDAPADRILVRFRTHGPADHSAAYAKVRGRSLHAYSSIPGLELVKTGVASKRAIASLRGDPSVRYAELDCTIHIDTAPNDPGYGSQWALHNTGQLGGTPGADIDAEPAWAVRTDASSVVVAIVDTGMDATHPDLAPNLWTNTHEIAGNGKDDDHNGFVDDVHGWDFVSSDNAPADDNGHGTHVAGTIGARGNNAVGVTGVAWQVKLMPLKAFAANGTGQTSAIVAAIDYAIANGARIINSSFGSPVFQRAFYDAYAAAGVAGLLTPVAAGNDGTNNDVEPHYPAALRLPSIIAVANSNRGDTLDASSNFGSVSVHLAAPGTQILSTWLNGDYAELTGTSMATPQVSGVAALLAAQHPAWTASQIRDRILGTTRAVPALDGKVWTGGVLDAGAALGNGATQLPAPPDDPTPAAISPTAVADPNPPPADSPTPPDFATPELVQGFDGLVTAPDLTIGADGTRFVAWNRYGDGTMLASGSGSSWTTRRLTSAFRETATELDGVGVALDGAGVPQVAVPRDWADVLAYSDPGIITVSAGASLAEARLTAACPSVDDCFADEHPRIVADAAGDLHVAFDRTDEGLDDVVAAPGGGPVVPGRGVYLADRVAGDWTVTRLAPWTAETLSIAVAPDGALHVLVARTEGSASGLYDLTNEDGGWSSMRLTADATDRSGSLAVDAEGGLHVAWARFGVGAFYRERSPVGTWLPAVQIVDEGAWEADLALDAAGHAFVAVGLVDPDIQSMRGVVALTNRTGSWVRQTVAADRADRASIAVDAGGHPSVAYVQFIPNVNVPIGVFVATDLGSGYATSKVASAGTDAGGATVDQAIDANGYSHVAFGRTMPGLTGVYYATNQGGAWSVERVTSELPDGVAIALDAAGHPRISYVAESPSARLAYATRGASGWTVSTVLTTGFTSGAAPALVADATGAPEILFTNATGTAIRQARLSGGTWTVTTVTAGSIGSGPIAIVGPGHTVHLAFLADHGADPYLGIDYVHSTLSGWTTPKAVADGTVIHLSPSIGVTAAGTVWVADQQVSGGVWAYSSTGGAFSATQVGTDSDDVWPSLTVDAAGRVLLSYTRSTYYGSSDCTVPACAGGPGLRLAVLDGGGWQANALTPFPSDQVGRLATGPDGTVRLVFRGGRGYQALTLVEGVDTVAPSVAVTAPASPTNATTLTFHVTFSEPVTGLAAPDLTVSGTATGCVVGAAAGGPAAYTVDVTGCSNGTVALQLASGSVADGSANAGPATNVASASVVIDRTAPLATAPVVALRAGARMSGTSLPVTLSWTGSDAGGAGIASYSIDRSVDAGATWSPVTAATTGTSLQAMAGTTAGLQFRIRATDKAGNVGTWVVGPALIARRVEESSASITRSGSWALYTGSAYSGGAARATGVAGRSATVTFTGRGIGFVTTKASSRGSVRIYVDGVLTATLNLHATSTSYRVLAWQRTWSAVGVHKVRIVVVGTAGHPRIDLDAFAVIR